MKDNSRFSYDTKGAAEYLATSKTALYALRKAGFIKCIELGRNFMFPKKELDRFNDKCKNDENFNNEVKEVLNAKKRHD